MLRRQRPFLRRRQSLQPDDPGRHPWLGQSILVLSNNPSRSWRLIDRFQVEAGRDGDAAADRSRDRAAVGVEAEHPLDRGPLWLVGGQPVGDVDAPDDQHLAVQLDLADRVCLETTVSGGDAARLQRAPEGPGQSPGGRGDQVVQGGRVRLGLLGTGAVMLGHRAVDPEGDRPVLGRSSAGTVAVRSGPRCRVTVTWER
jgi:hypothetical protein